MIPSLIIQGRRGLFLCSDPRPRPTFSRQEPDELEETWSADFNDDLVVGQVHPLRPGMIIDRVTATEDVPAVITPGGRRRGLYSLDVTSLGNYEGIRPTKILRRGKRRTLESGWDERNISYLSWHADWKNCKGLASTNIIFCEAHGFAPGQRVVFARKTGASGLTAQSSVSLGLIYFVVNVGANQFQLSLTVGGVVVDLTTDMTAGQVIAAEFALGARHPDHSSLFLTEVSLQDENTEWKVADCSYRGLEEDKPFHRVVTVNGAQSSSSEPISVELFGGWSDPRNTNFTLPEVVVTDTYLSNAALPTALVPGFSTPPNAPAIASYVLSADDPEMLVWNYPYGWTCVATPQQATLNSQIQTHVWSIVYRYIWPVNFR